MGLKVQSRSLVFECPPDLKDIKTQTPQKCQEKIILSILIMKFLAINIELFGVL